MRDEDLGEESEDLPLPNVIAQKKATSVLKQPVDKCPRPTPPIRACAGSMEH